MFNIRKGTITPIGDYLYGKPYITTDFNERIENTQKAGLINMIIIDGRAQSGKSTLARDICKKYDENYIRVFTVKQLVDILYELSKNHEIGHYGSYKWLLFDEVELESSRNDWWNERNKVLTAIVSSYGFLRINIVMTCPNIKGLSDVLLTNISMRILVTAEYDERMHGVKRMAFAKKIIWSDRKNKFLWITFQRHEIPKIDVDMLYEKEKFENFFGVQLPRWREQLEKKEKNNNLKSLIGYRQEQPKNWI